VKVTKITLHIMDIVFFVALIALWLNGDLSTPVAFLFVLSRFELNYTWKI